MQKDRVSVRKGGTRALFGVDGYNLYRHMRSLFASIQVRRKLMVVDMQGRADLHIHTKYSGLTNVLFFRLPDSVARPSDIVRVAEKKGLNVICVTDHDSIRGGLETARLSSSVDVVVGAEISSAEGEILGLFLSDDVPRGLSAEETVDVIHEMGGLAIAPHPFSAHCRSLGLRIFDIPLDGVEIFNAAHVDGYSNNVALRLTDAMTVATVGGSDAHSSVMVGNGYTIFDGSGSEELRRAILRRETKFAGVYTSLRQLVWFATEMAAEIHRIVGISILRRPPLDDTECERAVALMRRSSKALSLVGTTAFMIPPIPMIATVIGDRIHRSRSRSMFLNLDIEALVSLLTGTMRWGSHS